MSAVLTSSMYISTHALTEGDFSILILRIRRSNFNSRPHGGRHRPPEGVAGIWHFNSRPHGGRLRPKCAVRVGATFQLTPSRRATTEVQLSLEAEGISTHALTEGDIAVGTEVTQTSIFQLTPSRRATADNPCSKIDTTFQLTPSRRATRFKRHRKTPGGISTHALTEGDGFAYTMHELPVPFQLTPSRRATVTAFGSSTLTSFQLTPSRRATANLDKFFF